MIAILSFCQKAPSAVWPIERQMETFSPRPPHHWELLSEDDKAVYRRISAALCAPLSRSKRNKRMDDFKEILDAIDLFIESDEVDKWKRCLVCGVCRIPNGIALNIAQLKRLVFKCKSSINGSLKGLGYDIVLAKTISCPDLFTVLPQLRMNPGELRQWTVRMRSVPVSERSGEISPPMLDEGEIDGLGIGVVGEAKTMGGNDPFEFDHSWFDF
jgi:hypothetical protein